MRELTIEDIYWAEDQLKRFTYKRGWELRLVDPPSQFDDPGIDITFHTENTYRPGQQIPIRSRQRIFSAILIQRNEEKFARYLLDIILKVERHEAQEWLRRDGVMLFDPHK